MLKNKKKNWKKENIASSSEIDWNGREHNVSHEIVVFKHFWEDTEQHYARLAETNLWLN